MGLYSTLWVLKSWDLMLQKGEFKLGMHPNDIYHTQMEIKYFGQLLFTMVLKIFPSKARKTK